MVERMTKKEREQFDSSYKLIQKLMGIETPLSRTQALRIKGLTKGQYVRNKKQEELKGFSWSEILATTIYVYKRYMNYMRNRKFKDLGHKFNTIMFFIEKEIFVVSNRMREIEKQKMKLENTKIDVSDEKGIEQKAEYKRKTESSDNDIFDDLW